jgi:hypothetical protein
MGSRQPSPRATTLQDVEDGIEYLPQAMRSGASFSGGLGQMGADAPPFLVGQIRGVSPALHGAERKPPSCSPRSFQTVSPRNPVTVNKRYVALWGDDAEVASIQPRFYAICY